MKKLLLALVLFSPMAQGQESAGDLLSDGIERCTGLMLAVNRIYTSRESAEGSRDEAMEAITQFVTFGDEAYRRNLVNSVYDTTNSRMDVVRYYVEACLDVIEEELEANQ